ncbi:hypothetical protein GCM10008014_34630 [Paenibacillus silvae]|uniref:Uncharacterized protein n=1 Tax=Paenibacillus silvae TaxID=1325358 RepID=A0ABQ1ZGE0_9BACL|nr:DUF6557 family protein [Paenibacillus silvae]GGH60264.1 hypothetical protein GCM10008014_34630 [Paenibacillus silvae]
MIVFKEILNKVSFEAVWNVMMEYYSDMYKSKNKYQTVYESLFSQSPARNVEEMIIYIDVVDSNDSFNEKNIEYRVHGKNSSLEWKGYWDLSASNWEDWLGFYVDQQVLESFSDEHIVALCLYEMTWFGFSEEQIKNSTDNLENEE